MPLPRFILASASPRRRDLLAAAGCAFDVEPADIDEDDLPPGLSPEQVAEHLARDKAGTVAARHPARLILAADTVVATETDELLGKPIDEADARRIMRKLLGTRHRVITGVAAMHGNRLASNHDVAHVTLHPMPERELAAYLKTGNWQGKAGAYGLQHGDPFLDRIEGANDTIIGLPVQMALDLLKQVA
jgi:septum formation protein